MGWSQWALLHFKNESTAPQDTLRLHFPDTSQHWGWPFAYSTIGGAPDLDNRTEITYESLTKQTIKPGETLVYGQTGKQNEWAGMSGTVEVYSGNEKVCKVYYSCPWGAGGNKVEVTEMSETNWIFITPAVPTDGALGQLYFVIRNKRTVGRVG